MKLTFANLRVRGCKRRQHQHLDPPQTHTHTANAQNVSTFCDKHNGGYLLSILRLFHLIRPIKTAREMSLVTGKYCRLMFSMMTRIQQRMEKKQTCDIHVLFFMNEGIEKHVDSKHNRK